VARAADSAPFSGEADTTAENRRDRQEEQRKQE
jgi:hypothetical protein